jgi:translation initiation factor 1
MSRPKPKIPLTGPSGGMGGAFANLELTGLPAFEPVAPASSCSGGLEEPVRPGRVVLSRLTAHRGGKTVLVVDGFGSQHTDAAIGALAKELRARCGCGGTVRGRMVELQGDQPGRVREFMEALGFQVAGVK